MSTRREPYYIKWQSGRLSGSVFAITKTPYRKEKLFQTTVVFRPCSFARNRADCRRPLAENTDRIRRGARSTRLSRCKAESGSLGAAEFGSSAGVHRSLMSRRLFAAALVQQSSGPASPVTNRSNRPSEGSQTRRRDVPCSLRSVAGPRRSWRRRIRPRRQGALVPRTQMPRTAIRTA